MPSLFLLWVPQQWNPVYSVFLVGLWLPSEAASAMRQAFPELASLQHIWKILLWRTRALLFAVHRLFFGSVQVQAFVGDLLENVWLASFDAVYTNVVRVIKFSPSILHRGGSTAVYVTISANVTIDAWKCLFDGVFVDTVLTGNVVRCMTPPATFKHFNVTLTVAHSIFGWNSDSILLSYAPHVDLLNLYPSNGPTS